MACAFETRRAHGNGPAAYSNVSVASAVGGNEMAAAAYQACGEKKSSSMARLWRHGMAIKAQQHGRMAAINK